ncbi:MAG: DUF4900 domain-containing protein [Candidatus Omnitrophota bacterium]
MKKRGIVLIVSLMVLAVVLILTSVYFSGLISEQRSADVEKYSMQALELAEAGSSHAVSELRNRVRTDLYTNVNNVTQSATLANYYSIDDALGFLHDYAFPDSSPPQWDAAKATLAITPLNLNTAVQGSYNADLIFTQNGAVTNPSPDVYVFPYTYIIEATGTVTSITPSLQRSVRLTQGTFSITVRRDNFAKYALFTSHHRAPGGTTVWFTDTTNFNGPVSTNERFSFALNPSAHFTEQVSQHEKKARFYNNGSSILLNDDKNGIKDVPIFDKGFTRDAGIVNLTSSVSQADLKNEALGGDPDPGSNGIYIANDGTNVTGGIFIRSNASNISLTMSVDAGDDNIAVYNISQGVTSKVISVDFVNNTTTVTGTGSPQVFSGIPDGTKDEGVLIYANNDIVNFSGIVQKDSNMTVASERDIVITNNVEYSQFNSGAIPNALGYNNILGILSWGGDVRIGTSAPNNVDIHGIVMAPHGVFTVDNYTAGSPRGTATLLGGVITDFYGPFGTFSGGVPVSGYGRNFVYDSRVLNGMTPPYFPYLSNFTSSISDSDGDGVDDLGNILIWQDRGL